MASRDRDKFRSHPSGHQKRLKKAKVEAFMQKQRGCLEKFVSKKNEDLLDGVNSVSKNDGIEKTDMDCEVREASNVNKNITGLQNVQNLTSPLDVHETQNTLNDRCVKRNTHQQFPANNENPPRKFTSYHFYRTMSERVDREYSNKKDCVYCFCCKLFLKKNCTSGLSLNGINDWKNISYSLKIHEQSINHCQSLKDWLELKTRLLSSQTIDKEHLAMLEKEKNHWRNVLKRIICTVQFLSKHNDAFRGSFDKVGTKNNGKFLGLIEMMASFDDVMAEHIRRINNQETHDHYLGPEIQNELIKQMSNKVCENIVKIIKAAKYLSIMVDCTPDVKLESETSAPKIEEYFLDFISVESTTGLHLTNLLVSKLQEYNIDLLDCRGQGYDNGSNMKGQYQGVQSRMKQLNSRAFFTPCASHNLNLLLGDISKSSTKAISFFGIVQRIYCLFSSSTKRWSILKKHCQELTLKPLSETRWKCRVESIKAIRYQIPGIIKALEEVSEVTNNAKTKSEANSLVSRGIGDYEFIFSLVYDVEQVFVQKRYKKAKNMFDYESNNDVHRNNGEEIFKQEYFIVILDQAIVSMEERFIQFRCYEENFGFLFNINKLKETTYEDLMKHCKDLQNILSSGESKDIEAVDLY
ncbi:hypothetical protein QTP88_000655 [Uroleucon formosanum]